ncbi:MAG: hypothetical protein O2856_06280, partial [Planctomycetota bacterium]|nr:hypothetical protein [Planctomycetota bacterium]
DGVNVDGGPFGLHISNLSRACVGKELLVSAKLLKNDPEFKLRICEKLTSPTSCFEAYVVLNALYNEHALHIVDGMIFVNPDNTRTTIPVKILSGNTLITADLSQHSFSEVCRHYWESKLGVKSEQQRLWEESIERDSKR